MLGVVTAITGLLGTLGKSWIEKKKVKAEGKIKIETAKISAQVKRESDQGEMDKQSVSDMRYSWKDEFLVIVLTAPFIACFIPPLTPYVKEGFAVLSGTPEWYRWAFLGAIAASFGLRTWTNVFKK
jgi:hypothetical protein